MKQLVVSTNMPRLMRYACLYYFLFVFCMRKILLSPNWIIIFCFIYNFSKYQFKFWKSIHIRIIIRLLAKGFLFLYYSYKITFLKLFSVGLVASVINPPCCGCRSKVRPAAEPDSDGGSQRVPDHVAGTTGARRSSTVLHHQVPHWRAVEDAEPRSDPPGGDQLSR